MKKLKQQKVQGIVRLFIEKLRDSAEGTRLAKRKKERYAQDMAKLKAISQSGLTSVVDNDSPLKHHIGANYSICTPQPSIHSHHIKPGYKTPQIRSRERLDSIHQSTQNLFFNHQHAREGKRPSVSKSPLLVPPVNRGVNRSIQPVSLKAVNNKYRHKMDVPITQTRFGQLLKDKKFEEALKKSMIEGKSEEQIQIENIRKDRINSPNFILRKVRIIEEKYKNKQEEKNRLNIENLQKKRAIDNSQRHSAVLQPEDIALINSTSLKQFMEDQTERVKENKRKYFFEVDNHYR